MENNDLQGTGLGEDLVRGLRAGEQHAFSVIHDRYKAKLFYYVRRLVAEWHDVEDIVADSFLALWRSRATIQSADHLRNFLFLAARNRALNLLKSKERQVVLAETVDSTATDDQLERLELELIRVEMLSRIRGALDQLPPEFRRVFELSYIDERTPAEIARILSINPATVRSQKRRALEMLRNRLGHTVLLLAVCLLLGSAVFRPFKKNIPNPGTPERSGCI